MGEKNCKWTFAEMSENSYGFGFQEAMGENFKKVPYVSLVRESIQNSLDAFMDTDTPVEVSFSFTDVPKSSFQSFYKLREHVVACKKTDPDNAAKIDEMLKFFDEPIDDSLHFLKVSDYNTKGMNYEHHNFKAPFNAFVRSAGNSSKSGQSAGGSFGFGKAAYFNISPIKTLLVSTVTDNCDSFFEGVTMLSSHVIGGKMYSHVGYYDNHEGNSPSGYEEMPEDFRREVNGTDIYIVVNPLDEDDKVKVLDEMIQAVLRNFWMSIYENKLKVKVEENLIDQSSLDKWMKHYYEGLEDDTPASSKYFAERYLPYHYYDAVINANSDEAHIFREANIDIIGKVRLYIKRYKNAKDKVLCMRMPRMLIQPKAQSTQYGYYGVFVCDDDNGDKLLTKLENPAHNEWLSSNWKENGQNSLMGKAAISSLNTFIKSTIADLFKLDSEDGLVINNLDDYLVNTGMINNRKDNNPFSSRISKSKGMKLNTQAKESPNKPELKNTLGHVTHIVEGGTIMSSDINDILGGNKKPSRGRGGGTSSGTGTKPTRQKPFAEKKGKHTEVIPVKFRVIATKELFGNYHRVIIESDDDYEDCFVVVKVCGVDSDTNMPITDVDGCLATIGGEKGNIVKGLQLRKGKNEIKIKFADDSIHGLKLVAYETK